MIKAVLFDVDGVLLDSFEANTKFFQDLLVDSGYKKPSKREISKIFNTNMLNTIKFLTNEKSEERIKEVWKKGHTFPYPKELLKIPNNSLKIIRELKQNYKLGIVTNRIERGVRVFFEVSKMKKYFDVVVSYEDTKKHKPDPEPLILASSQLRMKPNEIVYIGDWKSDKTAAKSAGMKFIFYSDTSIRGSDARVRSFREIPEAVKRADNNE